jgi:hypothetical protein
VYSAGGKGGDGDVSIFPEEGLMVLDGVLLNEIIFVTNDLPKYAEKERVPQSFWFLNTVTQAQSTGHQIRTDCYHSVVHECKWLRERVESQQTKEIVYHWISQEAWRYNMDGPIDQFDKPTYIPTNEPLREAYFRIIAADVLVEDSGPH